MAETAKTVRYRATKKLFRGGDLIAPGQVFLDVPGLSGDGIEPADITSTPKPAAPAPAEARK